MEEVERGKENLRQDRLGFFVSYPLVGTRLALLENLRNENRVMVPLTTRSKQCCFQWSPYSKLNWDRALQETLMVSSYFAHHGLATKSALFTVLRRYLEQAEYQVDPIGVAQGSMGEELSRNHLFRAILNSTAFHTDRLQHLDLQFGPNKVWVLKAANVNNAQQVHFTSSRESIDRIVRQGAAKEWIVQEYLENPLLWEGKKFHVRCNVLAFGRLLVFLHKSMVVHIACEQFRQGDWENRYVHITNHALQKDHPEYDCEKNQKLIQDIDDLYPGASQKIRENIALVVEAVFWAFHRVGKKTEFFPMPNCFEMFGFDFLIESNENMDVKLLEINSGPALEGHKQMRDGLCRDIVNDTLSIVLDPLLSVIRKSQDEKIELIKARIEQDLVWANRMSMHGFEYIFSVRAKQTNAPALVSSRFLEFLLSARN